MELSVKTTQCPFLKRSASLFSLQEQTAEIIVPDSFPDMERLIYCAASPVVRSKEVRTGTLVVSGGLRCHAVYVGEEEQTPRCLDAYVPFSMRLDNPNVSEQTLSTVCCFVKSAQSRMLNCRKAMLRITVGISAECYENSSQELYALEEIPENLAVQEQKYSLMLPTEMQEKAFSISDEIVLDGQMNAKLCGYCLQPVLDENKVSGNKVLLKGTLFAKVLYQQEDGTLSSTQKSIPFSQYLELDDSYEDAAAEISFLCTGAEMDAEEDGDGTRLLLLAHYLTQCTLSRKEEITVYADAYGIDAGFTPQWAEYAFEPLLDSQLLRERSGTRLPILASKVADFSLYPDFVEVSQADGKAALTMPVSCNVLFYDENQILQGVTEKTDAEASAFLCEDCTASVQGCIYPFGEIRTGSSQAELSFDSTFSVKTYAGQKLKTLSGGTLTEDAQSGEEKPALSVMRLADDATLWELAKKFGARSEGIRKINHLAQDELSSGTLLLIPLK